MVLSPPCSQHQAVTTLTVRCLQQRMSCTSTKNMPTKFSLKTGTNEFFYLTSFHYMSCKSITLPLHKILNENLIERGNIDANKGGVGGIEDHLGRQEGVSCLLGPNTSHADCNACWTSTLRATHILTERSHQLLFLLSTPKSNSLLSSHPGRYAQSSYQYIYVFVNLKNKITIS